MLLSSESVLLNHTRSSVCSILTTETLNTSCKWIENSYDYFLLDLNGDLMSLGFELNQNMSKQFKSLGNVLFFVQFMI